MSFEDTLKYYKKAVVASKWGGTLANKTTYSMCSCCAMYNSDYNYSIFKGLALGIYDKDISAELVNKYRKINTADLVPISFKMDNGSWFCGVISVLKEGTTSTERTADHIMLLQHYPHVLAEFPQNPCKELINFIVLNTLKDLLRPWEVNCIWTEQNNSTQVTPEEYKQIEDSLLEKSKGKYSCAITLDGQEDVNGIFKKYYKDKVVYQSPKFYNYGYPGRPENHLTFYIIKD